MGMRTRRKWWLQGMRVALSCRRVRVSGPRRPLLRLRRGGWRACLQAAGWGRVAGRGPPVNWRPGGLIWSAAVGEGGAALRSPPSGLGWAGVLQCVTVCGLVSAGENSSRGLLSGAGGVGPGVPGVCAGGVCGSLGGVGVLWGVGIPAVGVCGSEGGERGGKGQGRGLRGGVFCVGVCVRLQRRVCVVSCRQGGWEEKLAVFCCRGKDFADECAYLVHLLVSGGKRVLWCWANVPVDGVLPAGEGVMWPLGGGPSVCLGLSQFVFGRWGWPRFRARSPWTASGA